MWRLERRTRPNRTHDGATWPRLSPIFTPVSPFHNHSAGDLVDELGAIKAEAADLKSREDALRTELIARGVPEAEGALFRATVTEATRWTLDTDRVKAEMGAAWYDAHCKVGTATTVRVSARIGALKRAA